MPLFSKNASNLQPVRQSKFASEKALQQLVEQNLDAIFKCRLVASEFSTGAQHAGRIDTLALSEDDNPTIIEYKVVESSDLINQSLFYLAWLKDHRGDFELAAQKRLGSKVEVDFSDVRVICIAPNYKKYDLHAVRVMGADLELWKYRLYENGLLYLEDVQKSEAGVREVGSSSDKDPVMVAAGKKAALTRANGSYTFDEHLEGKSEAIRELALAVNDFIVDLDPSIEVAPKMHYIAYKTSQNIVCMEVKQQRVLLYLKLEPAKAAPLPGIARDVTEIGHYGTGDLELSVRTAEELEVAKPLIQRAYEEVGG